MGSLVGDILNPITGASDAATAQKDAASLSAQATLESTEKNIEFQEWLWGEQKELAQPYADMGAGAIGDYQSLLNQPIDITQDPSYQFRLNEGQKAFESSAAAKGMSLSGAQAKALNRYGSDYASQEYGAAFNRRQTGLDNLYRMITSGQAAAAGQAATGSQMGTQVSSSILGGGQATAQMYSDIGNISAAESMSGWNTLMDIGSLGAQYAGAKG